MGFARFLRWPAGWVKAETEGGFPERFICGCQTDGIPLWGVRQKGEKCSFCCFAREYRLLRPIARKARVRMRVKEKHGQPFFLHRYRRRRGLVAGLAVYILMLCLLSARIWVITVSGNADTSEDRIREVVAQSGVVIGARMDAVDIKEIEISGLRQLGTLSRITVNPSGCVARVEAEEREKPPQLRGLSGFSDIVALRDGTVISQTVVSGQPLVKNGEAVCTGQRLITGLTVTADGTTATTRACGEILAETERQITVTVPLCYDRKVSDGRVYCRPTAVFLTLQIPLYADDDNDFLHRIKTVDHLLTVGDATLPLGFVNEYVIPQTMQKTVRTREQAVALAQRRLKEECDSLFFDAVSYTETGRQGRWENGIYTLTAKYRCVENIALEVPPTAQTEEEADISAEKSRKFD